MPLGPLRAAYVWPAPKSRFAVTGLAWRKSKSKSRNHKPNIRKARTEQANASPQKLKYEAR
jgi:hypothetical protein